MGDVNSTGIVKIEGYVARSGGARLPLNFVHVSVSSLNCMAFAGGTNQINYRVPTDSTELVATCYYTKIS